VKSVALLLFLTAAVLGQTVPNRYVVELAGDPAAIATARQGSRFAAREAGFAARRAAVRRSQTDARTRIGELGGTVLESMDTVVNALIVSIPDARAAELSKVPGVVRVHPVHRVMPLLNHALPVHKVPDAWSTLPLGQNSAGAGIKIGMIDTGIDVNNPAFSDPLPPVDGFPRVLANGDLAFTNAKIIVAKNYTPLLPDGGDPDANDRDGHGTGTSMAAAGGTANSPYGPIIGVAPKAYLGNYKVLDANGGTSDVIAKAIDDAVADGMDVLNISLGSYVASYSDIDPNGIDIAAIEGATQAAYDDYIGRSRTGNHYFLAQTALSQLSKALVLGYGGWMVLEQRLTPGDVVMFVAYLDRLFEPVESLSSMAVSLQQHLASLRRAVQLLQTGPEEPRGAALADGPGKVEFCDVRFGYTPRREVLHGLSFTIEPARTTALTGPSGAGKTTAADLLMKLWEPDSGEIRVDGQPLSGVDPASVRRAIGMVATDGAVFPGTLADNIRYKRPDATDAEVREAALAAGLGGALERLPDGLDTAVGERGIGLSVGERQRLQIARMLVDQPRILVLDEATSNLDYATEAEVKSALSQLRCGGHRPTTLVIAHRYSMIKDADHVIVLEQGRILAQGAPAELVAAGGWFAELAAQATGEDRPEACPTG